MTQKIYFSLIALIIGVTGCATSRGRDAAFRSNENSLVSERLAIAEADDSVSINARPRIPKHGQDVPATIDETDREKLTQVGLTEVSSSTGESNDGIAFETAAKSAEIESKPDEASGAYTLSLGNVLYLADAQNPNVAVAREKINEAYARVERAETLWLPSLRAGLNYNHHEGAIQDVAGKVFNTTRSSFYGGMGSNAVGASSPAVPGLVAQFHLTDAVFQPKIAEHQASARQFGATAARNDTLRDAAVAYLELVRAEHAMAIAKDALANTEKLAELTRQYADKGQGLQSDHQRSEAELALRQEELVARQEGIQVASARLAQILHADPSVEIESGEPAVVPLNIVTLEGGAASYVATGLSRRPELAEQKHLVCEAVERLRREKYAPLIPSVLLGMSYGGMGGGLGTSIVNTNDRWDADAVAYWEVRNLGFGEKAARDETSSLQRQAQMREVALMDRVAREVAEAHSQVTKRQQRIELAQRGVAAAQKSYALNVQRIENAQGLPIETLQSIQALANAQRAYLNAVIDYNIAQFELSRAIGWFVES
ncbi:MAG: TolC family protein [Planctomycetaceae bacterium]